MVVTAGRRRGATAAVLVLGSLALWGCEETHDIELVNACDRPLVVRLWETPTPGGDSADDPEQVEVPPLEVVVARDALAAVGDDGSAAEIVSGPGEGEVLFIPHGDRTVIIPAGLCG
jgi:hypothetical protein